MPATARGQRTRQLIIDSTAPVFGQQGYAGATLNQLVESTGLTRGAFYFHFESKDALAVAIAEEQAKRWQQMREQVEQDEQDPMRRLVRLFCLTAYAYRDDATVRAASRLLLDRGLIERELPRTAPWWRSVITGYLGQARAEGQLTGLGFLLLEGIGSRDAADEAAVGLLTDHLLAAMATVGHAASSRPEAQFRHLYATWVILLPAICADPGTVADLTALARELLHPAAAVPEQTR